MNRRRIEASEIFSIPESASLDTLMGVYSGSVEASMLDQGGDPYLRIASSRLKDNDEMTEEDIQEKIQEWKTHTKDHATNAGFRKAHKGRGPMDPRRFALQLAEVARSNASRYRSPSLLRLAKRLRWVAGQERGVAARALAKIAAPLEEEAKRRDQAGMPFIQKPQDQDIPPSSEFNEESQLTPGETIDYSQDQSWRARESGRFAKEKEIDSELLTMARDFLQDYKSQNSLYDDDLLDQIQDSNIFDAWLLDLGSKGVDPDPDQLDEAWNEAMNEIAEGSGESVSEDLEGGDLAPISATRGGETTIQRETAPGGDWFNTVINLHENPVMDRYLREMKDKREGRSRVGRKIEVEGEIAAAVDQCLDHFAGDMLPGEISSDHVRKFIEDGFPDIDWEKVWDAIQKISDPKKRHEEDPKERTNQEASRKRLATGDGLEAICEGLVKLRIPDLVCSEGRVTFPSRKTTTPASVKAWDRILEKIKALVETNGCEIRREGQTFSKQYVITRKRHEDGPGPQGRRKSRLKNYREICACCKGTGERGERGERCCGQCQGSGQVDVSAFDEDLDRKEKIASRLGTLLVVSVDAGNRSVSTASRQELARVTRTRVASKGSPLVLKHSIGLMKVLVENGIPYRTSNYQHSRYKK